MRTTRPFNKVHLKISAIKSLCHWHRQVAGVNIYLLFVPSVNFTSGIISQTSMFETLEENKLQHWAATHKLSYIYSQTQPHHSEVPFCRTKNDIVQVLLFCTVLPLGCQLTPNRESMYPNKLFSHAHFSRLVRRQQRPVQEGQLTKVTDGQVPAAFHRTCNFPASLQILASFLPTFTSVSQYVHVCVLCGCWLGSVSQSSDRGR